MADKTKIEWCDSSWNPIVGCTPVSEGCAHCYAQSMIHRFWKSWGLPSNNPEPVFKPRKLDVPHHWRKPRRIFVCSMADLFHEAVKWEWVDRIMAVMAVNTEHTFMVLTKRPARMLSYMEKLISGKRKLFDAAVYKNDGGIIDALCVKTWMENSRPNLWLGVTAENQARANERIPILLPIPAAVHFISIEPMLGEVDLDGTPAGQVLGPCGECGETRSNPECEACAGIPSLDWVIVGGETGPGAREMQTDWLQSVFDQCNTAGVPFFYKKAGDWLKRHDPHIEESINLPREFPEVRR